MIWTPRARFRGTWPYGMSPHQNAWDRRTEQSQKRRDYLSSLPTPDWQGDRVVVNEVPAESGADPYASPSTGA